MSDKKNSPKVEKFLKGFLILTLIVVAFKFIVTVSWPEKSLEIDNKTEFVSREDFVNCLKTSGLIMYGVNGCEFCQQQKKMFGSLFEQLDYVNCEFEQSRCEEQDIHVYPVWELKGQKRQGIQTFRALADLTNCPIPTE